MALDTSEPSRAEVERWFLDAPAVAPGTFEFALVLGGTASAGAYTAGAVDFLVQALDCLADARRQRQAPLHEVVLRLITGSSGGAANAAVAARALAYDYPHVEGIAGAGTQPSGNPFHDLWVDTLGLGRFLELNPASVEVTSVLNGAVFDDAARQITGFAPSPPRARPWVAAPLRLILTLSNLRGIPYRTGFGGGLAETFVDHADHERFAVVYPGQAPGEPRPDERVLGFDDGQLGWDRFTRTTLGASAYPLAFPARALSRPTNDYRYRVIPFASAREGRAPYLVLRPDWHAMAATDGTGIPESWHFLSVDGGMTDNQPIELARTALAGLLGRNPRDPAEANRAVWVIDPFAGRTALGPAGQVGLLDASVAVLDALTQQPLYDTSDMMLAADPDVFSRFMLTARRPNGATGSDALAGGGLGHLIGFASPAFARHDYALGQANCQEFLRSRFVLAEANPLFRDWSNDERAAWRRPVSDGARRQRDGTMLPIIPLVGAAAVPRTPRPWPAKMLDPEIYRDGIETRFRSVFESEVSGSLKRAVLGWLGAHAGQRAVADAAVRAMQVSLAASGLGVWSRG